MKLLLVGDLHLTDHSRDAHRFGIFEWVKRQQNKHLTDATIFMGDITHAKDRHHATLVNRIVGQLCGLNPPVFIIKGNHDYIDESGPFFDFLNEIEGIELIAEPQIRGGFCIIPHMRDETAFAKEVARIGNKQPYLFLHQTIAGAIAETGAPLSGFSASPIESLKSGVGVYAGDVHRPQRAGRVTYVGAPYTIRFGDDYNPRCILLGGDPPERNLYFDCSRKWKLTIRSVDELIGKNIRPGDQVKITLELVREEAVEAKTYMRQVREVCRQKQLEIFGIEIKVNSLTKKPKSTTNSGLTPTEIILSYSKVEGLSSAVREAGVALTEG